jgi:hypothetical protein
MSSTINSRVPVSTTEPNNGTGMIGGTTYRTYAAVLTERTLGHRCIAQVTIGEPTMQTQAQIQAQAQDNTATSGTIKKNISRIFKAGGDLEIKLIQTNEYKTASTKDAPGDAVSTEHPVSVQVKSQTQQAQTQQALTQQALKNREKYRELIGTKLFYLILEELYDTGNNFDYAPKITGMILTDIFNNSLWYVRYQYFRLHLKEKVMEGVQVLRDINYQAY